MNDADLTLRDYFAAAALTGLLANPKPEQWGTDRSIEAIAYEIADNMLAEGDEDDDKEPRWLQGDK